MPAGRTGLFHGTDGSLPVTVMLVAGFPMSVTTCDEEVWGLLTPMFTAPYKILSLEHIWGKGKNVDGTAVVIIEI